MRYAAAILLLASSLASAQTENTPAASDPKDRAKYVRDSAREGSRAIPKVTPYLDDVDVRVRVEAVKTLVEIGGRATLDPLVKAAGDSDAEVQIRAVDGLVNFYVPGYLKTGLSGSLSRAGNVVKVKFSSENTQVVEPGIDVRPEVVQAIGKLIRTSPSNEVRANAARAVGILRGRQAVPDLLEAIRSKQDLIIYESLIALQKIGDRSAGPRLVFLARDLDTRIQTTAIETLGLLYTKEALPTLRDVWSRATDTKVKRATIGAMARIDDPQNRDIFTQGLVEKDESVRTGALEGLARMKNPEDVERFERSFETERKMEPRLAAAFGLAMNGRLGLEQHQPLQYLVSTLNSKLHGQIAEAYLIELSRDPKVREALYPLLAQGSREERGGLARALAASGDQATLPYLQTLARDQDLAVAQEGIKALRLLRSRLQ
jgi:HEAT repeat protein